LEHLLQPLDDACALVDLRLTQAGEIPEPADLGRRHKARAHQPLRYQVTDPLGVFDIRFRPGTLRK